MNERDELARALAMCDGFDHDWWLRRADAVLAAGYRKTDPDAETRTEYGVRYPGIAEDIVDRCGSVGVAHRLARSVRGTVVVSRTVTAGPWQELEQ